MARSSPTSRLTDQQKAFVREYLIDLNGSAAYRRAGYKPKDEASARSAAARLLANVNVSEAVRLAQQERSKRTELTQDYVLTRLREEANLQGPGACHSARVTAIKLIGLHLGMFPQKHRHGGPDDGPIPHEHKHLTDAERVDKAFGLVDRLRARGTGRPAVNGTTGTNGAIPGGGGV